MKHCPEIHHGLYLQPIGTQGVKYAPCCQAKTATVNNNDFSFKHDSYLLALRDENTAGVQSTECNRCWEVEDAGGVSKRQGSLQFAKENTVDSTGLQFLEYNVNWSCNLACVMCGPEFSSRWAKELGLTDSADLANKTKNQIIDSLDLSTIKRIHFNGGEPLLNEEHVKLLKKIDNINQCKLTYNTNGTVLPSKTAIQYWEQSRLVQVWFSIDATDSAFEYIRWPGHWQQVQKNIQWYIDNCPSNVMFGLNVTVGSYNLLEIDKLYRWFENNIATNREGDPSDFNWQTAYNFDYKYLPDIIKDECLKKLSYIESLKSLYNNVEDNTEIPNNRWITKLDNIDLRRGTDWKTALEIGKYYK